MTFPSIVFVPLSAGIVSYLLIILLQPLLKRYALARPNARSSHTAAVPQGGGVAVIVAAISTVAFSELARESVIDSELLALFTATIFIMCVGAASDLIPIPVLIRLFLQATAISVIIISLPHDFHLFHFIPVFAERILLLIAALWFVNLVNFMDGLDWITVAEIVPVAAAVGLFGIFGHLPGGAMLIAGALVGAMIGFAPFNRPVAKLFLGDAGSLPIGLLTGWCLLQLAGAGHLVAAVLLPLYYLADATITLGRRLLKGERIWRAHRSHFYQRATENGFSVMQVVTKIFQLNIALAGLAALSIAFKSPIMDIATLALGAAGVALLMLRFSRRCVS